VLLIPTYVGRGPSEKSSGDRRRCGHISKQRNTLLRFLQVEAAQWAKKIAKVAMARKLAV